jgi:hypothetical protein
LNSTEAATPLIRSRPGKEVEDRRSITRRRSAFAIDRQGPETLDRDEFDLRILWFGW